MAIIAIDQVARRVAVIDVVRQRGSVAAILIIAVVIRLRHDAADGLAAQLVRALIRVGHGDARVLNSRVQARQQAGRRAVGVRHGRHAPGVIPVLLRQAVGSVVDMLRALLELTVVILAAADQAAEAVVFVVILFPRRRGLLCKLSRGIVGIFICDVIILFFCRPVKFVVGILNSLVITKRHFLQSPVVHAAFVLVFCEHDRARRCARRGVVRAADAYLRHVAEGGVREVVALPRERARADAAFACERR